MNRFTYSSLRSSPPGLPCLQRHPLSVSGRRWASRQHAGGASALALTLALMAVASALLIGYWLGQRKGEPGELAASSAVTATPGGKKLLYYRNPMGLPDTSQTPKKDSMGMDYVPVYEGEDDAGNGLNISAEKIQKLGVRVAPVERRTLDAVVRATARVEIDESRLATITPKFDGYVERLFVNATGQVVRKGETLFETYSPQLLAASREYALAVQGMRDLAAADPSAAASMRRLADAARERLRTWDLGADEIARLTAGGAPARSVPFRAPAGGVVLERQATVGMRFTAGEMLYRIADLSRVWLIAEVFEQDLGRVRVGQPARVWLDAYPGEVRAGRVSYVYPTLAAATRSAQVRIELDNADGRLKPAMYARVELATPAHAVLAVPASAVIDSGRRQLVLVDRGAGRFEPREVTLGMRGDEYVEVAKGLVEGEHVVVAANFLLDAESNLKAALSAFTGGSNANPEKVAVRHSAVGTLDQIDAATGRLLITHEPVAALNWPAMTMEFVPATPALVHGLKPGAAIRFEFVERAAGEWVVVEIAPTGPAAGATR